MLKRKLNTHRSHADRDPHHRVEQRSGHNDEHHGDCGASNQHANRHHSSGKPENHHEGHHGNPSHAGRLHSKRLLRHGDLHLLVLSILSKQPSYGYEIIKTIDSASSGFYEPSPGTIYPTLTFLEERGFLESKMLEGSKKNYSITSAGTDFLISNADNEKRIWAKLEQTEVVQKKNAFSQELEEAIRRFKLLLRHKLIMNELTSEKVKHIAEIINAATSQIEEVNSLLSNRTK